MSLAITQVVLQGESDKVGRFDQVWEFEVAGEEGTTKELPLGEKLVMLREFEASLRDENEISSGRVEGSLNDQEEEDDEDGGPGGAEGLEEREESIW